MLLGGFFGVAVSLKKSPVWSPLIGYKAMKHDGSRREQACKPQVMLQVTRALALVVTWRIQGIVMRRWEG